MTLQLKKAVRQQKKLKIGISAASGFGKTKGALLLAYGMTNDWEKIAVIDTENDSASLYVNHGGNQKTPFTGEFLTVSLAAPFSPERYIEAIKICESAGVEVIIVDSITHEWDGKGGCLEIHDQLGGKYQNWSQVTPRHRAFQVAILESPCHVITTVRRKQDYETSNENGRLKVQKVGTKEVTRDGWEYELDINFEITNANHLVSASKDRTGLFAGRPEFVISTEIGKELLEWSKSGAVAPAPIAEKTLQEQIGEAATVDQLNEIYMKAPAETQENEHFLEALKARKDEISK